MPRVIEGEIYVGVDPGASGGLALLIEGGISSIPIPKTEADIWDWFREAAGWLRAKQGEVVGSSLIFAVIEQVGGYVGGGGQPGSAMFKFGYSTGLLTMALTAAGIPFERCTPQRWQKALGIAKRGRTESKGQFKNRLKSAAQRLFPSEKVTLATADALLLAEYCRRLREGKLR